MIPTPNDLPLSGLRVVDFTWVWAGPYCTRLLAEMGAEVIKVESRKRIDNMRLGAAADPNTANLNIQPGWHTRNRNKLSINLDLTHPEALALCRSLIEMSDVVVDNFAPRVLPQLGLGYEELEKINPRIIQIGMSGMGASGPYRDHILYGNNQTALAGVGSMTGYPEGEPVNIGTAHGDPVVGYLGAFAIMAAVQLRRRTGHGTFIDMSQWEGMVHTAPEGVMDYTLNGRNYRPMGNRDEIMAPHGMYPCEGDDAWVAIAVSTDAEWESLCRVIGHPEWVHDPRFNDAYQRWKHQEWIDEALREWTFSRGKWEVTETLQAVGVAAAPTLSTAEMVDNPHIAARGFWVEEDHTEIGKALLPGPSFRLSRTPGRVYRAAPLFGEHNDYVFKDLLGLSDEDVQRLVREQIAY